jgi:hypothetical protein
VRRRDASHLGLLDVPRELCLEREAGGLALATHLLLLPHRAALQRDHAARPRVPLAHVVEEHAALHRKDPRLPAAHREACAANGSDCAEGRGPSRRPIAAAAAAPCLTICPTLSGRSDANAGCVDCAHRAGQRPRRAARGANGPTKGQPSRAPAPSASAPFSTDGLARAASPRGVSVRAIDSRPLSQSHNLSLSHPRPPSWRVVE